MQNSIINENIDYIKDEIYQTYLLKTLDDFKDNKYISIKGKLLHYSSLPTLYYYINFYKKTNINPFEKEILFCFEFIDNEIPYVTILTDFIEPTLNDNRNYYRCLTKKHNYKFYFDKKNDSRNVLKSMINGIKNFLNFLKESIKINYFVYFGEYEFKHIYQINDFLSSKNNRFYRINVIKNNLQIEAYIIITKLYFMICQPLANDRSLMKLIFIIELNEINFNYDKNDENHSLILDLTNTKFKGNLEFILIDRKHIVSKENKLFDKEKNDINYEYSGLIKEWFTLQNDNIILFKKYIGILNNYRIIFDEYRDKLDIIIGKYKNIGDYEKLIDFYEKILNYYETKQTKKNEDNERIHEIISNIIYICSELINHDRNNPKKNNRFLIKIQKFLNSYK